MSTSGERPDAAVAEERKPGSHTELTTQSWRYLVRKTWREFSEDQCTDQAAALTYYAVLAIFPVNKPLMALNPSDAGPQSRAMLVRWGKLHAVRSALGAVSVLLFAVGFAT